MSPITRLDRQEDRRLLLREARRTAESILTSGRPPADDPSNIEGRFGGVFVTFWRSQPRTLRGCVGSFASTEDIVRSVRIVTGLSLDDPRFEDQPISAKELQELVIEISLLSDPAPLENRRALVIGTHGVIVRRESRSGCFLPHVAVEQGWNVEELLSKCCALKAGLPPDAWRDPSVQVLAFTADAFSELNVPC